MPELTQTLVAHSPNAISASISQTASVANTTAATAPSLTASTKARITFTFSAPPTTATARIAPTLYNKSRVLQFEEDDSPLTAYTDVYPVLKGGKASNGVWYSGLRFTDGCGRRRPYTAAVAINGHNPFNQTVWLDPGTTHDASKLLWSQAQELIKNGWDIENHSDLHTTSNPSPAQQLATLDGLISSRLGYKATVFIVPSNYSGYCTAAFGAGYLAVSSASQSDGLPVFNLYNPGRIPLSTLPAPNTSFVYKRYLADLNSGETTSGQLTRLKGVSDALMATGTTGEVYLQRVYTHHLDVGVLANWLTYTQNIAQDRLWVTTLREFAEYRRVSRQVVKSEYLSGNTLTVDLDYAGLSANTRFQNLSLLVNSPGTITSISVTGADSSTYNTATKMVNVFRGTTTASTSSPTIAPPPTGSCTGTGTLLREEWDNVTGTSVSAVPVYTAPTKSGPLYQFESTGITTTNFGARLRGYICPPQSGSYTFWLTGDDTAELWLSTDSYATHKVRIASCTAWTSGVHDWYRSAGQQSAPVQLVAGQRYYVEALHKQEWGSSYLSVAWKRPDGIMQGPIPGSSLIPFSTTTTSNLVATDSAGPDAQVVATRTELSVYPNPFSARATLQFSVVQSGPVTLTLYNLNGQLVRQLFAGTMEAGTSQTLPLAVPSLSAGLYMVRLVTPAGVVTKKISCIGE